MNIAILESNDFSEEALSLLKKSSCNVFLLDKDNVFVDYVTIEVLFVRLSHYIDGTILNLFPSLRFIVSPTTGHNHLDLDLICKRGIKLISLQGHRNFLSTIRATPEHTLGLILAILRRTNLASLSVSRGKWDRDLFIGDEIYKSNIGIIGFGRVGSTLASYLLSMGAKVGYYDINSSLSPPNVYVRHPSLVNLIDTSSIIVLCASCKENSVPLINRNHIEKLKGKYFINTSRGELVDEKYLLSKIHSYHFKGVALDVLQHDSIHPEISWYSSLPEDLNVIITPHISGASFVSMRRTEIFVTQLLLSQLR